MLTAGRLARRFGLSRSALLYYDRIGLLRPSSRSRANYRRYTESDVERLTEICACRELGLPLQEIREVLDAPGAASLAARGLRARLRELYSEVTRLREEQRAAFEGLVRQALQAPPSERDLGDHPEVPAEVNEHARVDGSAA